MTRIPSLRLLSCCAVLLVLAACGDDDAGSPDSPALDAAVRDDASTPQKDAGGGHVDAGPEGDAGDPEPPPYGGLVPDTDFAVQQLDLFGTSGHRLWFEVSDEQLARINLEQGGGGFPGPFIDDLGNALLQDDPLAIALQREGRLIAPIIGGGGDDIYTPGNPATWADHLIIEDADTGSVADYGQVEVALVGESTGRAWDYLHIPNVRIDANEFEKGKHIGGYEHVRLNNGLVGSIFREAITHRVYRELGYPALRASWAFMGSNAWGPDVWVPMTLIEVYKKKFCKENAEVLGGGCENMWEFVGNVGEVAGSVIPDSACQVSSCDHTRLEELNDAVAMTPAGPGIEAALQDLLDWDRFRQFQCLSWMLWTGDDPIHSGNNNLIIERDDGRLVWAPYSVDISAGQDWYMNVPLTGTSPIAMRCQADPECWAKTIAACEGLIERFDQLDPEKLVDDAVETLTELDMMRSGDERRAEGLREWYVERQKNLPDELERFRYLPDSFGNCPIDLQRCGDGGCGTVEQCDERRCELGRLYCESKDSCVDPVYEPCPSCGGEQPVFCTLSNRCVATQEDCQASCELIPGQSYCAAYDSCLPAGECPSDEDGGVIGGPIVW